MGLVARVSEPRRGLAVPMGGEVGPHLTVGEVERDRDVGSGGDREVDGVRNDDRTRRNDIRVVAARESDLLESLGVDRWLTGGGPGRIGLGYGDSHGSDGQGEYAELIRDPEADRVRLESDMEGLPDGRAVEEARLRGVVRRPR